MVGHQHLGQLCVATEAFATARCCCFTRQKNTGCCCFTRQKNTEGATCFTNHREARAGSDPLPERRPSRRPRTPFRQHSSEAQRSSMLCEVGAQGATGKPQGSTRGGVAVRKVLLVIVPPAAAPGKNRFIQQANSSRPAARGGLGRHAARTHFLRASRSAPPGPAPSGRRRQLSSAPPGRPGFGLRLCLALPANGRVEAGRRTRRGRVSPRDSQTVVVPLS